MKTNIKAFACARAMPHNELARLSRRLVELDGRVQAHHAAVRFEEERSVFRDAVRRVFDLTLRLRALQLAGH